MAHRARSYVVTSTLALAIAACGGGLVDPNGSRSNRTWYVTESIQLGLHERATIAGSPVVVEFLSANDYRCPSDVQCVWAGDAEVVLRLTGSNSVRVDTLFVNRIPRTTDYGPYQIELVGLEPYPKTATPNPRQVVTLRLSRPK